MSCSTGLGAQISLESVPGTTFAGRVIEICASPLPVIRAQAAARAFPGESAHSRARPTRYGLA